MPRFIVKPDRDQDWYVEWSTVVDCPMTWGNRAEMQQAGITAARVDRADKHGTSMIDAAWFAWHDTEFMVGDMPIADRDPDLVYSVPRGSVRALCERLQQGGDVTDLLTTAPIG